MARESGAFETACTDCLSITNMVLTDISIAVSCAIRDPVICFVRTWIACMSPLPQYPLFIRPSFKLLSSYVRRGDVSVPPCIYFS
jgi:hypothetical protein